jgi:hypothetical protein
MSPRRIRAAARVGVQSLEGYFGVSSLTRGGRVAGIVRSVKTGDGSEGMCSDVMKINRPADLGDIANLDLTPAEGKLLLLRL